MAGSVEESVYQTSVTRRLAHIAQKRKKVGKSKANDHSTNGLVGLDLENLPENVIDSANSLEMQEVALGRLLTGPSSEGERVDDNDLWQCLFGKAKKGTDTNGATESLRNEVDRILRADKAEERRDSTSQP